MSDDHDHQHDHDEPSGANPATIDLDTAVRLADGVGALHYEGETVLLHPDTGVSHLLDGPGSLVVQCYDGASTLREIAYDIADELHAEREVVAGDVLDLTRLLGNGGLLDGYAADPHAGHDHSSVSEGLPVGADLGPLVSDLDGTALLVNWGTSCGWCTRIAPELADVRFELEAAGVQLLLLTTGTEDALAEQLAGVSLPVRHVDELPEWFQGIGTPVAYVVAADGTVAEPIALGAVAVPKVARRLAGVPEPADA